MTRVFWLLLACFSCWLGPTTTRADERVSAVDALERATGFLRSIATHGGYVGIYSLDLKQRYGEAKYEKATHSQIWVQPPGTPSVGEVFLRAYRVTGNRPFLAAAREVGLALAWGQRTRGGWDHRVDVSHRTSDVAAIERKTGHCSLDDDITQAAIRFLMELDQELDEPWLDESVQLGLRFMIEAQFENGAWPQWFPLRGGYHDYYTFNDNTINDCIGVMLAAHRRYGDSRYLASARRGGDFIIASQLPAPQAGWAQQYDHNMQPAAARAFEPAGLCSAATARNIRTLIELYLDTSDRRYLTPIPGAIDWLSHSKLPGDAVGERHRGGADVWARLYELKSNRPIYGDRKQPRRVLYRYADLSETERRSYAWQGSFGIPGVINFYQTVQRVGRKELLRRRSAPLSIDSLRQRAGALVPRVRNICRSLDEQGRWIDDDEIRIGTFVKHMNVLCEYLETTARISERDH